jgi:rSAM/selenodomain-associated transferase 1
MARAPVPGRCKSRLAAVVGESRAAALYEAMLLDTLDALSAALPAEVRRVVMAAPEEDGVSVLRALAPAEWEVVAQLGDGLGARLADAVLRLGAGGDTVALVDSDSPTVDFGVVARSLARLREPHQAMMGPCTDGGYYLIALTSPDTGVFAGIDWSTPRVQEQTRARCTALGIALHELPLGHDVDDAEGLARLRAAPEGAPRTVELLRRW